MKMLQLNSMTIDSIQRITMIIMMIIAFRFQSIMFIEAAPKWKQQMGLPAVCTQDPAGSTVDDLKRKYDKCHDDHIRKWKISLDDYYTHTKKFCCFVKETYQCEYEILEQCMSGASLNVTQEKSKLFDKPCDLFYLECNPYSNFWEDNWLYITTALLITVFTTLISCYCWRHKEKFRSIKNSIVNRSKPAAEQEAGIVGKVTTTTTELKGMDWDSLKDPLVGKPEPEIDASKLSELIKSELSDVKDLLKTELERQREAIRDDITKTTTSSGKFDKDKKDPTDTIDQDDGKFVDESKKEKDLTEEIRYFERQKLRAQMRNTLRKKKLYSQKLSEEEKQWKEQFEAEKSLKMSEKDICRMDEQEKLQQIQRKQIIKIINKIRDDPIGESYTFEQLVAMYNDYVPREIKKRYKDAMIKKLLKQGFGSRSMLKEKTFDEIANLYQKCIKPTIKDVRQLIQDSGAKDYIPFKMPSLLPRDLQDIIDYD